MTRILIWECKNKKEVKTMSNKAEKKSIVEIQQSDKYYGSVQGEVVKFFEREWNGNTIYDCYLQDGSTIDGKKAEIKIGIFNPNDDIEKGIIIEGWGLYTKEYTGSDGVKKKSLNMKQQGSGYKVITEITIPIKHLGKARPSESSTETTKKEQTSTTGKTTSGSNDETKKKKNSWVDNDGGIPFDGVRLIEVIQENTQSLQESIQTSKDLREAIDNFAKTLEMNLTDSITKVMTQAKELISKQAGETNPLTVTTKE